MTEPPADMFSLLRVERRGTRKRDVVEVFCAACGQRLVVAPASQEIAALELAYRNATERPCCAAWEPVT